MHLPRYFRCVGLVHKLAIRNLAVKTSYHAKPASVIFIFMSGSRLMKLRTALLFFAASVAPATAQTALVFWGFTSAPIVPSLFY